MRMRNGATAGGGLTGRGLEARQNPSGSFTNPGSGPRLVWRIGDTENITFTTVFDTYTIALWQQHEEGGGANLGPIIFQLGPGQKAVSHFIWNVQIFNFDLEVSPTFFLWIYNGSDPSSQGQKLPSVSSAYFTIKEALKETASTTSPPATTALPSSTSAPASPSASATDPVLAGSTGTNSVTSTVVPISVGVSVGVVALAVLGALLFWFVRKKRRQQAAGATPVTQPVYAPPMYPEAQPYPHAHAYGNGNETKYAPTTSLSGWDDWRHPAPPVELHANPERAELS
ncbi:hypothetical protein B0H67DRAFT_644202 [Lasiosphaeris hirsuta]|uniref:Uncharacterized protein n=1 Tax=Lasiosphaeris hirsuta TaxID=260670 RepID=A0AA40E1R1_9PEZI|nr:hypothetical protein B0H67DRAFT_644202 [Lasiosphaeris hirsuta]